MRAFINFGNGDIDLREYTAKNSGIGFNHNLCSTKWKSVVDTASLSLVFNDRNRSELALILDELGNAQQAFPPKDVSLRIEGDDGEVVFRGFVDLGKLSYESSKLPGNISLSANSKIKLLDKKTNENFHIWPGTIADVINTILPKVYGEGTVVKAWESNSASRKLEVPFVVTDDDSDTWQDRIDTLLYELGGFVLVYSHKDDSFAVRKINNPSVTADPVPVSYLVSQKLKSTTTKFAKDGVVVKYTNLKETESNQIVYQHDISLSNENGKLKGTEVPAGAYFPLDSDIEKTMEEYTIEYKDENYAKENAKKQNSHMGLFFVEPSSVNVRLVASDMKYNKVDEWYKNSTFTSPGGGFTYPGGGEFYPRKAWLCYKNILSESVNVTEFSISGKAWYYDREYSAVLPGLCTNPEEYTSSCIADTETAKEFASFLLHINRFGTDTSTWTEKWDTHSLGAKVKVRHKSGQAFDAVIVRKVFTLIGGKEYAQITAVNVDESTYIADTPEISSSVSSAPVDDYSKAVQNGFVGTKEEWESRNDMYYLWSSSPDKLIAKSKKYWRFSGKKLFMLFHGKVMGDFGMQDWEKSWEKLMESRTETYNYLWAKVGENGEPFRLQGVSPMDFSVLATPPSYTVNPRRKDQFKITVKLTRLNGIKGASALELYGGPYDGIVINSSLNEDEWEILVFQNTTTSLEFKLKASIGGVEKVIGLSGTMIQNSSKYMGAVSSLPTTDEEGNKLIDGDWCVLKSDNLMYVYKSGAWKSITDSEVSSFDELEKMSIALADMIAIGSTKSTTATVLGIFKLLCADNGFIKFLKTWALYCGAGDENSGFYCRIADHDPVTGQALSKPVFIVKYDGQTVFQIDPSSGNVFFGKPNTSLNAPESGFMYDASNNRIVTKDNKLIINEDGSITAKDGSFSGNINANSGIFGGDLNGATGTFTGSFITPSLESRPPAVSTPTATLTLPSDASGQFNILYDNIDKTYQCTLSSDSEIKYITMYKSTMGSTSYYEFYLYDSNMHKKYYNSRMTYKPLIGSAEVKYETTIPAGVLTIGTYGDVLVFKDIPYSSEGLEVGQIYQNTDHQLFIKTE